MGPSAIPASQSEKHISSVTVLLFEGCIRHSKLWQLIQETSGTTVQHNASAVAIFEEIKLIN